jgi:serine/threonine-protein kinase
MKQEIPTPIAVAIVVVLLAIVAGVGYWIYTRPEPAPPAPSVSNPTTMPPVTPPVGGSGIAPAQPRQPKVPTF